MSTQSGITASKELEQSFQTLKNTNGRALVVEIEKETCVPGTLVPSSGGLAEDFPAVQKHLKDNEARYIILREGDDNNDEKGNEKSFAFISFVPDHAPVRSKMLYASSAHAVHRQLGGSELFSSIVFWSEMDEVSHNGWLAHKRHEQSEPPQTEEELALRNVREKETQEMSKRQHSYYEQQPRSGSSAIGGISLQMNQEALEALESLKASSEPGAVGLAIDLASETVVVRNPHRTWTQLSEVYEAIPDTDPQYTLIKHVADGNDDSGVTHDYIFVYTCPSKSKIKERMVYASNRSSSIKIIKNQVNIPLKEVVEASDSSDLHNVIEPLVNKQQQVANQQDKDKLPSAAASSARKFNRPKPPGRR